ncbi:MAG: glycosyltransferase family 2 protein [Kiritimatiellales bacterium]|jgi:cellulose synthase/poly-beta-1,6-N-acetylglucosamine synthase-like glycosyltransferase
MHQANEWIRHGFDVVMMTTFVLSAVYFILTVIALFLRRRTVPAEQIIPAEFPRITVQIPTYNELAALNCAERCLAFEYPENRLQILIGDDSNKPEISAQINAFAAERPRVKVCRRGSNVGFKPGNLNHMLEQTTGDYILILDSDFLPEKDFLRRLVQPVIKDPSLAGVQAAWRITNVHQNHTTLMGAGIINVIHIVILPFIKQFAHTGVFCGSAELVRKDLLLENGGWTPGALTEDVDYSLRVIAAGGHIVYLEDLHCACEVPYTPRDLFRQQMRWAYGVMRAFINHGRKLLLSRLTRTRTKLATVCFGGGYVMVTCFILTALLGLLSIASAWGIEPAGGSYTAADLIIDTAGNFLLTCGMLISSLCASFIAGISLRNVGKLVLASLSIGLVLIFFVGKGLFKAAVGLPMQWFMVRKNGNAVATA